MPPPGSPNPGSILDPKKCHFPHPFSVLEVVTKHNITCLQTEIMLSLIRRKPQQTDFLKVILNPHTTLSSFLELKRRRYTAVVNGTRLQANTAQNSCPLGRHIPIWFISGPSPLGEMTLIELHYFVPWTFNAKMNE